MASDVEPIPGNWYLDRGNGLLFQVVDLDGDDGAVEIQLDNGDLDAIPGNEWGRLDIEPVESELRPEAPTDDVSDGDDDLLSDDPEALQLPSDQERYRREYVQFAGKSAPGFPEPRPEHGPERKFERGSEMGIEQWPETRDQEQEQED